jgi:hypothetical protein
MNQTHSLAAGAGDNAWARPELRYVLSPLASLTSAEPKSHKSFQLPVVTCTTEKKE